MANNDNTSTDPATRARRGSFTTQTFNNIFGGGRSNSTSGSPTAPFPSTGPITTAAAQDQRRRMSISTLGLSGSSPTQTTPFTFGPRRGSVSTDRSDSIDESAIDDDDGSSRSIPSTPFARRMSYGAQALRARTQNGSPGANGRSSSYSATPKNNAQLPTIPAGPRGGGVTPPKTQASQASTQSKPKTASDHPVSARPGEGSGFNWSEQLRSRAESSVSQTQRPSFSTPNAAKPHDRNKSVSEMPTPPMAVPPPAAAPARPASKKPDAFQERILKGDFYMD
ncbi:hypothetical protein D0Z07_2847 [Hyphodiscus hymeniophilus]|uniref:Uncharacterized protein n=1 Tax=Hyphodiscus hymeniophilus TaxID=353542 RepID=A0A9P6VM11_9HELO|nr:hypothetical protein D0Z07_2847 [Hyphodiscus hymeniophilus]